MTDAASLFPAPRVAPNPWHALGGIWRLTTRRFAASGYWLMTAALLGIFALLLLAMTVGQSFHWAVSFYFGVIVPIMAFLSAGGAVGDDLKPGALDYLFTRPMRRPAYVAFKYVSQMACLQVDCLLSLAVLLGMGFYRDTPGLGALLPQLLLAQILLVMAFSALGMLAAFLTSRYVLLGIVYAAIIEVGLGRIPTPLHKIAITGQVLGMLQPVLDRLGPSIEARPDSVPGTAATLALVLGFTALTLTLSAGRFSRQELAGGSAPKP